MAAIAIFALIGMLIIANPLTQYLSQQEHIRQERAQLEAAQQRVAELEQELELWSDPLFIQSQARERLGYVMPGQTLYTVVDPNVGDAQEQLQERTEQAQRLRRENTPFYVTAWDSIAVAGQAGVLENPDNVPIRDDSAPDKDTEPSPAEKDSADQESEQE
ncbi:MAG: septum formation initiator family protein [Arcanobacterium sp.]